MIGSRISESDVNAEAIGTEDGPWRIRVINTGTGALTGVGTVFALEPKPGTAILDLEARLVGYKWVELFQNDGGFAFLSATRSWDVYVDGSRVPTGSTLRALNVRSDSVHRPKTWLPQEPTNLARTGGFHQLGWYKIVSTQPSLADAIPLPAPPAVEVTAYLRVEEVNSEWRETIYEPAGYPLIWPRRPEFFNNGTTKPEVHWKIEWLAGQSPPNLTGWYTHVYYSAP